MKRKRLALPALPKFDDLTPADRQAPAHERDPLSELDGAIERLEEDPNEWDNERDSQINIHVEQPKPRSAAPAVPSPSPATPPAPAPRSPRSLLPPSLAAQPFAIKLITALTAVAGAIYGILETVKQIRGH